MTTPSEQLIAAVHPALNVDPDAEVVVALAPTVDAYLAIDDTEISIYREGLAPVRYALADYTLAELVAALPATLGATLYSADWAAVGAVALVPGAQAVVNGGSAQLAAYTSALWRTVRPIAAGVAESAATLRAAIQQLNLHMAEGTYLDLWGLAWNIPRLADEPDATYRTRIIYMLTRPRANGQAIADIIQLAFGRTAEVVDDTSLLMILNGATLGRDTWGPGDGGSWGPANYGSFTVTMDQPDGYSIAQLVALIQQLKAAGTVFALNTRYAPEVRLLYADVLVELE